MRIDDQKRDKGLKVNRQIRAPEVRVISDDGSMLGIYTVPDAVRLAEEKGLDLIEISPNASPPTCKIMDFGKYKYEQKKKAHEARKNQTVIVIKEIQLRPRTDEHDLGVKLKHARRFLEEGDKVKFNLRYRGREMAHKDQGFDVLDKVVKSLEDLAIVEVPPKLEGRQAFVLVAPDPVKIKEIVKAREVAQKALSAEPAK
ncbi:MAG: translation initiation factor IF-3 [Bdellovibrionales bacterium CG10_big_fil_rev_8_21_14_0_10_45_34]|nr:MAG: translation initiation factor IF-3 [Bdellovibrionales bacterium CG10_big_fil_rev_8_21_14_0_10_45_34]